MKKFIGLFKKVGGKEILKQYLQAHVLIYSIVTTLLMGFSKKSLEIVRLAVNNKIVKRMRKKNAAFISTWKKEQDFSGLVPEKSNKVWFLWLQGIDQSPSIVKKCYQSLLEHMPDREIILLTDENYREYVTFPPHIQEKIDSRIITRTHMSDLLRLELLNNYGGTWIDATVYCSGSRIPDYMLDSDLFFFQNMKPGLDGQCTCLSSWFMTSSTNNPVLLLTRDLLYEYWKHNTKMVDYFLLHDFFQLALEAYPEIWNQVVPFSNAPPHILLLRLFENYNETIWNATKEQVPFHKLTYKFDKKNEKLKGTYYDILVR